MSKILKTRRISDAKIQFVSLVDKAANQKSFLIAKSDDGSAAFTSYGRIVKADTETHHVTGIVYEPLTKDSQGDYMTAEEIQKAAYWFAKNSDRVDLQHSNVTLENTAVVESWIAKADFELEKEKIKKGTWLVTVEITDPTVWEAVEKGELTGFSMGGRCTYTEEEVSPDITKSESKSLLHKIAKALGIDTVEKGDVADNFKCKNSSGAFWDAFYSLQDALFRRNPETGSSEIETDPDKIKECLAEFSEIVQNILTDDKFSVSKLESSLVGGNLEKAKSVYENMGTLLKSIEKKEENDMTKEEVMELIRQVIGESEKPEPAKKQEPDPDEELRKLIIQTVKEVLAESQNDSDSEDSAEEPVTKSEVAEMVKKALEPIYKSRGIPTNLNNELEPVRKSEDVFDGMFV